MGMAMKDKIAQLIVWGLLPYRVRYWVVIRAWADATQWEWSNVDATTVTAKELLDRMK